LRSAVIRQFPRAAQLPNPYYGHFLDLKIGRDALISNFSSSVQRAVRKAERSGLSVRSNLTRMQWQRFTSYMFGRAAGMEFRRSRSRFLLTFNGI
jgi:hypothetical protein